MYRGPIPAIVPLAVWAELMIGSSETVRTIRNVQFGAGSSPSPLPGRAGIQRERFTEGIREWGSAYA